MDEFRLIAHHRPSPADTWPEGMRRLRMTVEYDGTAYSGWQRQKNAASVQETLEEAVSALTGEKTGVIGSSRTDAGVHARGLCVHMDTASPIPCVRVPLALNAHLPPDIRVRSCQEASPGFHARYSACAKVYSYRFYNDRQMCALGRQYRAHVPVMMDTDRMRASAAALLGTHDFAAFAASGSVAKTTVRTVHALRIDRRGPEVTLWILGNGFLYNMVRIIAGTLQEIGTGKRSGDAFQQALSRKDRLLLGQTAPAQGLTLEAVFYEGEEERLLEFFTQDEIKGR